MPGSAVARGGAAPSPCVSASRLRHREAGFCSPRPHRRRQNQRLARPALSLRGRPGGPGPSYTVGTAVLRAVQLRRCRDVWSPLRTVVAWLLLLLWQPVGSKRRLQRHCPAQWRPASAPSGAPCSCPPLWGPEPSAAGRCSTLHLGRGERLGEYMYCEGIIVLHWAWARGFKIVSLSVCFETHGHAKSIPLCFSSY